MNNLPPNIKAFTHPWTVQTLCSEHDHAQSVLVTENLQGSATYAICSSPYVISSGGRPHFGLTLMLERRPNPDEKDLLPLIKNGLLTLDLGIGISKTMLDRLNESHAGSCHALLTEKVVYQLSFREENAEDTMLLAEMTASGIEGRGTLQATLSRDQALAVLQLLQGNDERLQLLTHIEYKINTRQREVRFRGNWAAIYDFLAGQIGDLPSVGEAVLKEMIKVLTGEGLIKTTDATGASVTLDDDQLFRVFRLQSAIIFQKSYDPVNLEYHYALKGKPNAYFNLNFSQRTEERLVDRLVLETPAHQVLAPVIIGKDWNDFVELVATGEENPNRYSQIPKRVRSPRRADRADRSTTGNGMIPMVVSNSGVVSVGAAVSPAGTALTPTDPFKVLSAVEAWRTKFHFLGDYKFEYLGKERPRSLPVLNKNQGGLPLWKDRLTPNKFWYAPVFELIQPDPAANTENSPFLFSFERKKGMTSSGDPILEGEVRFTFRKIRSEDTLQAISKKPKKTTFHPVPTSGLSILLSVPFKDATTNKTKRLSLRAKLEENGNEVIARFHILNQWVKIAYGVLAYSNFSTERPVLQIAYTFQAYEEVKEKKKLVVYGGKTIATPVVYQPTVPTVKPTLPKSPVLGNTYFDANRLTLNKSLTTVKFNAISGLGRSLRSNGNGNIHTVALATSTFRAQNNWPSKITTVTAANVNLNKFLASKIEQISYARYTHSRYSRIEPAIYCNTFGHLYRQFKHGAYQALGCRDAFKLGEASARLFEEILELKDPAYRVFRLLQQPGYFMVLPTAFCISRKPVGQVGAYDPFILLNVVVDNSDPANNRVELRFTLQPDIPVYQLKSLKKILKEGYHESPTLLYPNDFESESIELDWLLANDIEQDAETDWNWDYSGPFISALFSMTIPNWMKMLLALEQTGVIGTVSFNYQDEPIPLASNLLLKLDHIRGPWLSGPVDVKGITNNRFLLTNRSEQTVEVKKVLKQSTSVIDENFQGFQLEAGSNTMVDYDEHFLPVYHYPPSDPISIKEIRASIEEFEDKVIFFNPLDAQGFDNYGIEYIEVEVRILSTGEELSVQLSKGNHVAEIPFILPLTNYLDAHLVEYRLKIRAQAVNDESREDIITEYYPGDLNDDGIISIAPEFLWEILQPWQNENLE